MNPADLPETIAARLDEDVRRSATPAAPPRLRELGFAALGALLAAETTAAGSAPEERFLRAAHAAAGGEDWPEQVAAALALPAPVDAALLRARRAFGLDAVETIALALVVAVEDDPVACRLLAWLQAPNPAPRPTLGLLARALAPLHATWQAGHGSQVAEAATLHTLAYGAALRHGLMQLDEGRAAGPLCETPLRVPAPLAATLAGVAVDWPACATPPLWPLPAPLAELAPALDAALCEWARDLMALPRAGLVIRSAAEHEACGIAAELVRRLGAQPAWFSAERSADGGATLQGGAEAWLVLSGRIPVFSVLGVPGEVVSLPALRHYAGPVVVVTGLDGGVRRDGALADWRVPLPDLRTREALWAHALARQAAGGSADDATALAP
ncbi:hypothetical protein, partial [Rhodoferax sp.]|uniref:hypothetical protein n=1 Tax=Rhodoferax sp. TaxID=50421 RepID=UPI00374CBCB1